MARLPFSEPWVLSLQIHLTCNQTTREAKNDGIVCVWCVWCVCVRVCMCVYVGGSRESFVKPSNMAEPGLGSHHQTTN